MKKELNKKSDVVTVVIDVSFKDDIENERTDNQNSTKNTNETKIVIQYEPKTRDMHLINKDYDVKDIKDLLSSTKGDITFLHSKKFKDAALKTKASFCITTKHRPSVY